MADIHLLRGASSPGKRSTVFARTKWLHFYKSPHRVLIIPSKTFRSRAAEQLHCRRRRHRARTPPEHELRVYASTYIRIHKYNIYTGWSVLCAHTNKHKICTDRTTHCSRKGITAADDTTTKTTQRIVLLYMLYTHYIIYVKVPRTYIQLYSPPRGTEIYLQSTMCYNSHLILLNLMLFWGTQSARTGIYIYICAYWIIVYVLYSSMNYIHIYISFDRNTKTTFCYFIGAKTCIIKTQCFDQGQRSLGYYYNCCSFTKIEIPSFEFMQAACTTMI